MIHGAVTAEFSPGGPGPLHARLAPPAQQARLLRRPRVEQRLSAALDHPISLLVAPAGSGKTTALAGLRSHGGWPVAWLRADPADDPAQLLRHLWAAFEPLAGPPAGPADSASAAALSNQLAARLADETLLVIDDAQHLFARPELWALVAELWAGLPPRLHLLLAARLAPELPALRTAALRGELLELGPADLAFDQAEAGALAGLLGRAGADAAGLTEACAGWPLAVQAGLGADDWRAALGLAGGGSPGLRAYLAQELLAPLGDELRPALVACAGLRQFELRACAALIGQDPAAALVERLARMRLFVAGQPGGSLGYSPLLAGILRGQASQLPEWPALQRRAAEHFRAEGRAEDLLHHLLLAGDRAGAAAALVAEAPAILAAGRPDRVLAWIRRIDSNNFLSPRLLELLAAAERRSGAFALALEHYQEAERAYAAAGDEAGRARALRGHAEVFLDTVQPALATDLLRQAIKLVPRERAAERAELLRLQAENWANRGRANLALILERAALRMERGDEGPERPVAPPPRLLLRAGRLGEARQQIEAQLWAESQREGEARPRPAAHREPMLLLALIYAMLGSGARALALAGRCRVEAEQSGHRLTAAIAELRLGHAYQLIAPDDPAPARQRYAEASRMIHQAGIPRTRAEAYLGQTMLYGFAGDLPQAEAEAREGLLITGAAGDEWTAALILLGLGGAATSLDDPRAAGWLEQARQRFARGGDSFGQTAALLWQTIGAQRAGRPIDALVGPLIDAIVGNGYLGLLTAPSLFGPRDMAMVVPLLLRARAMPGHAETARQLLRQGFPGIAADSSVDDYHPGFTLRVQMLGTFRIWRGSQEIQARDWQRDKARQLLQLLLTQRGHWVQREQICALLWPDADLEAAERQFKVTLNALNSALEPARPPRVAPFFIRRQGLAYSFAPSYGAWIDVDEFELRTAAAAATREDRDFVRRNAQIATRLYRGDYLAESLYDPWTIEERERLLSRYLAVAVAYASLLSDDGEHEQAVELCEQVLRRDRAYEEAYQLLMRAHARAGSRSQALRSYQRCVQALRDELGMEPLPETSALYRRLKRNEPI